MIVVNSDMLRGTVGEFTDDGEIATSINNVLTIGVLMLRSAARSWFAKGEVGLSMADWSWPRTVARPDKPLTMDGTLALYWSSNVVVGRL